jgi:hypothetical protein
MILAVLLPVVWMGRQADGQINGDLEKLEQKLIEARRQGNHAEVAEIQAVMAERTEAEAEDGRLLQQRLIELERELAVARRTGNDPEVEEILRLLRRLTGGTWREQASETRRVDAIDVRLDGISDVRLSSASCGFALAYAPKAQSQVAVTESPGIIVGSVGKCGSIAVAIPVADARGAFQIKVIAEVWDGRKGQVCLSLDDSTSWHDLEDTSKQLAVVGRPADDVTTLFVKIRGVTEEVTIRLSGFELISEGRSEAITLPVAALAVHEFPRPELPPMHPGIERALIEWDWRMQDGIGTKRQPRSYEEAIEETLERGNALLRHLTLAGTSTDDTVRQWNARRRKWRRLRSESGISDFDWEVLWREVHQLRREMVLQNPLANTGPIAFVKCVPTNNSIMQQQYIGRFARPAGGVFLLQEPGRSMRCRSLTEGKLPFGAYQHLDVSYDGERVLFSFCQLDRPPRVAREGNPGHYFDVYQIRADGSGLTPLIYSAHDDFAPRYLPDGNIAFVSTRRGGYSRCGPDFSPCHTLALADSDGSNQRLISFHEIHEFDPTVMNDGRIIYTRWDYVDREASLYQQLWVTRPDGTNPVIYYGNNTFNPMATFEPRAIPDSNRMMAIAGCHHSIAAGSVVLINVTKGVDDLAPLERLTPDVLFPETEARLGDHSDLPRERVPVPAQRWPLHTYKSPFPLSEEVFLASYSFDRLIYAETKPNPANMFGLYLVDRFGNKELLYRDLNVSSLWAMPVRARRCQTRLPQASDRTGQAEGTFYVQNVYEADPPLPSDVKIAGLRVIHLFPRTSEFEVHPRIGIPVAACGREVLGTVPVEADGSAYFEAPAGVALAFQALDELGQSVQFMRSVTYLQPGENVSCVGCHEHRMTAPPNHPAGIALRRGPSEIRPGPDGSKPFSYPLLVQPVLDRHCIRCHGEQRADGDLVLTGAFPRSEDEDRDFPFSVSYLELARRVKYAQWSDAAGERDFRSANSEPLTQPDFFGARSTPLIAMLRAGHEGVILNEEELERLITWADNNVLFYGTFDPEDQARQRRGQRITGPLVD